MKILNSLFFVLLTLSIVVSSCNSKKADATQESTMATDSLTQDPGAVAAVSAGSQHHFICPKNCEGSGGAEQGNCPVCGTAYVHNQSFHNQSPTAPGTQGTPIQIDPNGTVTQTATNPAAGSQPITDTPANPAAKNAAGEWHFVCSKACGGGAGAQGNCPKCGSPLTHNQDFHK